MKKFNILAISSLLTVSLILSACGSSTSSSTSAASESTTTVESTTTQETTAEAVTKDLVAELSQDSQLLTTLKNIGVPLLGFTPSILNNYEVLSCNDNNSWFDMLYSIYHYMPDYYDYSIYPVKIADKSEYPESDSMAVINAVPDESFQWIAQNIYNASQAQISLFNAAVMNGSITNPSSYYGAYIDGYYASIGAFATEGFTINEITINSATEADGLYYVNATYNWYFADSDKNTTVNLTLNKNEVDGVQYWALKEISLAE